MSDVRRLMFDVTFSLHVVAHQSFCNGAPTTIESRLELLIVLRILKDVLVIYTAHHHVIYTSS